MSKEITKELYDKAAAWMADKEDPSLLVEGSNMDLSEMDVNNYLIKEAFDIMFRIYEIYNEAP